MRKLILCIAVLLVGCASIHGNFIRSTDLDQQALAADVVAQLATLYPPAWTRLQLAGTVEDPFGSALVDGLREQGYAVLEAPKLYAVLEASKLFGSNKTSDGVADNPDVEAGTEAALPMRYVLDRPDTDLYRLTLWIGPRSITRPYRTDGNAFVPIGYWTYLELDL